MRNRAWRCNVSDMGRHWLRAPNPLLWGHHSCHLSLLHRHSLHWHTLLHLDHTTLLHNHPLPQTLLLLLLKLLHPNLLLLLLLLQRHPLLHSLWHWLARLSRYLLLSLETSHNSWSHLRTPRVD